MATTLSDSVAALARQVALDQITQDLDNAQKFVSKADQASITNRLLVLEDKVTELITKVWAESEIEPLTLNTSSADASAFEVRLSALEKKVEELRVKTWKQEALS